MRLRLLRLNTMGPLADGALDDAEALAGLRGDELRRLGRLPYPMIREHGEGGPDGASGGSAGAGRSTSPPRGSGSRAPSGRASS